MIKKIKEISFDELIELGRKKESVAITAIATEKLKKMIGCNEKKPLTLVGSLLENNNFIFQYKRKNWKTKIKYLIEIKKIY